MAAPQICRIYDTLGAWRKDLQTEMRSGRVLDQFRWIHCCLCYGVLADHFGNAATLISKRERVVAHLRHPTMSPQLSLRGLSRRGTNIAEMSRMTRTGSSIQYVLCYNSVFPFYATYSNLLHNCPWGGAEFFALYGSNRAVGRHSILVSCCNFISAFSQARLHTVVCALDVSGPDRS